ncbi:MAG TPA: 16S rRNA (cytidine(1402)-2'-O)-methyltransferase [Desulfurobacteriaceae bacterium]|nr:16S rRNA (cytidine(1402)-2'-O)-methyltransferase [Desulfurobacteriaceae bacterium]
MEILMKFYLISTPIGNIEDISLRALKTLENLDILLCEDTRQTKKLLTLLNIENVPKLLRCDEYTEEKLKEKVLNWIKEGKKVGLVSDAGTPLISDPGYRLVSFLKENKVEIIPVPGPSAFLVALLKSAYPCDKFAFLGFFPRKSGKLRSLLEKYLPLNITLIFYESPYRIEKTLKLLSEILKDRKIGIARELTKLHEEFIEGSPLELLDYLKKENKLKGEFVILIPKEKEK